MFHDIAKEKRNQLIKEGYCVIDNVLSEEFLQELQEESDRMLDAIDHPPHWK